MATRKAAGTAKNLAYNNPQYLGVKKYDGESVQPGNIIMRQRGTKLVAGVGTAYGKDFTIYALKEGKVNMTSKKMTHFDGTKKIKKIVNVI